ncbi:MAG: alpha/beta hydrolase [Pirellulales bacterium]|nr:alpha/beta hydrolase [Pirellulales bacterium]
MQLSNTRINDFNFSYVDEGTGPVVLLVHGFPLSHLMWRFQVEALRESYRVIVPDLRGFGESKQDFADPQTASLTMEEHADDLAALLDATDVREPVAFAGLSMGGYIAWQFWRRHRERVDKLILCDTRSAPDTDEARENRYKLASSVLSAGSTIAADVMIPKMFWRGSIEAGNDYVDETREVIRATPPVSIAAALRGMAVRTDSADLLPEIDVPTLLIAGTHDELSPPAEMRGIADAIAGSTFVEIPDAGHMSPLENSAAVNEALLAFLRS